MKSRHGVVVAGVLWLTVGRGPCQPPPKLMNIAVAVVATDEATPVPWVGVTVTPVLAGGNQADRSQRRSAHTDDQGQAVFPRLLTGRYLVRMYEPEEGTLIDSREVEGKADDSVTVRVVAHEYRGVRLTLTDPQGGPLPRIPIKASVWWSTSENHGHGETRALVSTQRGELRILFPAAPRASLALYAQGLGWWWSKQIPLDTLAPDLGDVQLRKGGALRVRVIDEATGKPVPQATCTLAPAEVDLGIAAATGNDGVARFAETPLGRGRVLVRHEAYHQGTSMVADMAGVAERSEVTIALKPRLYVSGTVQRRDDGRPVAWTRLSVIQDDEWQTMQTRVRGGNLDSLALRLLEYSSTQTDLEGRFRIQVPQPGRYAVLVAASPNPLVAKRVAVEEQSVDLGTLALDQQPYLVHGQVFGADGTPRAGAQVEAWSPEHGRMIYEQSAPGTGHAEVSSAWDPQPDRSTLTDKEGRFGIAGLPAGRYLICARDFDAPITYLPNVVLAQGSPVQELSIHMRWEQPLLLHGRLLRAGEPVVGRVSYEVWTRSGTDPWRKFSANLTEDGQYAIRFGRPGTHALRIVLQNSGAVDVPKLVVPSDKPLPPLNLELVRPDHGRQDTGSVQGTVSLPDGKTPATGARVYAFCRLDQGWAAANEIRTVAGVDYLLKTRACPVVDHRGRFLLGQLPPGRYALCVTPWEVRKHDHAPWRPELAGAAPLTTAELEVRSGQKRSGLRLVLPKAATVHALVRDARTGAPVPGASLYARHVEDPKLPLTGLLNLAWPSAASSEDGTVTIPDVPPGTYYFFLWNSPRWEQAPPQQATVTAEGTQPEVVFELVPKQLAALTGRVFRADRHEAIAGATVRATEQAEGDTHETQTDVEGRFRLPDLPVGRYRVVVAHPEFAPSVAGEVEVSAARGAPLEIPLRKGGTVSGRVTGTDRQRVNDELWVVLRNRSDAPHWLGPRMSHLPLEIRAGQVNVDGSFALDNVGPGEWSADLWAGRHLLASAEGLTVRSGETTAVLLTMPPLTGSIRGTVAWEEGDNLGRVRLYLWRAQTADRPATVYDTYTVDGSYVIDNLPPGIYYVQCMFGESAGQVVVRMFARTREPVRLGEGNAVEGVDLTFKKGPSVRGTVVNRDGTPFSPCTLTTLPVHYQSGPHRGITDMPVFWETVTTDERGRFHLPNMQPGKYVLSVLGQHLATLGSVEFEVRDQEVTGLRIEVQPREATSTGRRVD